MHSLFLAYTNRSTTLSPAADIISISIGGYGGWGQGEEQLAVLNKLVQNKGSIIVVAAANDGAVSRLPNSSVVAALIR
jgi:alpha-galactosidase/6-phospho-beta-glucosidase family protein